MAHARIERTTNRPPKAYAHAIKYTRLGGDSGEAAG